jgi:hypothetical protein
MKDDLWKTIHLGPLPVSVIARCLGLQLTQADVIFYPKAQEHAFGKDPNRHPICMPHLLDTVATPTHVGQQPGYKDKGFDLVRAVVDGPIVLIGIRLMPLKKRGVYTVESVYPIDRGALARRVRIGTSIIV